MSKEDWAEVVDELVRDGLATETDGRISIVRNAVIEMEPEMQGMLF